MAKEPIFIVSGGYGTSGERVLRTALAQFETEDVPIFIVPNVTTREEIDAVIAKTLAANGSIVHTLVNSDLRGYLTKRAQEKNVEAADLMGPVLMLLKRITQKEPLGKPGLYRELHEEYFKRIDAIEFTVDHDDGRKPEELDKAEIVLTGVSRVGKTPLSMYLSTLGWKVANVPLMQNVTPPAKLFEIDYRRVVGLMIDPGQLVTYRTRRQQNLGTGSNHSAYVNPEKLVEELEFARQIFRRGKFAVVNTTDKPIEETANEVLTHVMRRLAKLS